MRMRFKEPAAARPVREDEARPKIIENRAVHVAATVGLFLMFVILLVAQRFGSSDSQRPPPVHAAAQHLSPQLTQFEVLHRIGAPSCAVPLGPGMRLVWQRVPRRGECIPDDGDLVILFDGERKITSVVPEFGRSRPVASREEWMEFHRRYDRPSAEP